MVMQLINNPADREFRFLQADLLIEEEHMEEADKILQQLAMDEEYELDTLLDIILDYVDVNQKEYAKKWIDCLFAKPSFTEIHLITDSNHPQSVHGFIPPSSIPESWRLTPITTSETDSAYKAEWKKSEIGRKCPLLVLPSTANSHLIDRNVRRANFSGGWDVEFQTNSC